MTSFILPDISSFFKETNLTPEQKDAVTFSPVHNAVKKNLVIEAGAGAGKTKVLSERVRWLLTTLSHKPAFNPSEIFLVTFTNDAQKELRQRVDGLLFEHKIPAAHLIHISTIDSLFDSLVEILFPVWWERHALHKSHYTLPPRLTLISQTEAQNNLEKEVFRFLNESQCTPHEIALALDFILSGGFKKLPATFTSMRNTFDSILKCMCEDFFLATSTKNIRIVANKIHPATIFLVKKIHAIARQEYEKRILKGEFTYADKTVFLSENLTENLPFTIKELIVDEYQDTNSLQHDILFRLVNRPESRMVVVGDPKQSIYGFRGASVNVFKSLLHDETWAHIVLNKSFRTDAHLLQEVNLLSGLAFEWQNPRLPEGYKESFFYEEAQKKYIAQNPLVAGKAFSEVNDTKIVVHVVSASIPKVGKKEGSSPGQVKLKINEHSLVAYGIFLKEYKIKKGLSWNDMVVLCEKNAHVLNFKNVFLQLGIPLKPTQEGEKDSPQTLENHVALALTKCLAGKEDLVDWYLLLQSPLFLIPSEEIASFFAHDALHHTSKNFEEYPHISPVIACIEKYKGIAKHNFFYAWQVLRWDIVGTDNKNAQLFCAQMDGFGRALGLELSNFNKRTLLETSIESVLKPFPLSDDLTSYSIFKKQQYLAAQEDSLDIKTVHKAKGLEWPCVCFYPKYGLQQGPTGEFIAALSQKNIDITWLQQDNEGLSVVARLENEGFCKEDSFVGENQKKVRFADVRKQQEEEQERQRVFYTAFTRPQTQLVLFQPACHHSSQAGIKAFAKEHKDDLHCHYLEQEVLTKYLNLQFDLEHEQQHEIFCDDNKQIFLSHNKRVELSHYNLAKICTPVAAHEEQTPLEPTVTINTGVETSLVCRILAPKNIFEENDKNFVLPLLEEEAPCLFMSLDEKIKKQQERRQKRHKGLLFHAAAENRSTRPHPILTPLEKIALVCKRELEIWSKPSGEIESKRNIIDLFMILPFEEFCREMHENPAQQSIQTTFSEKRKYVALIVDFKTGKPSPAHYAQVFHYMDIAKLLFDESLNTTHNFTASNVALVGVLAYVAEKSTLFFDATFKTRQAFINAPLF